MFTLNRIWGRGHIETQVMLPIKKEKREKIKIEKSERSAIQTVREEGHQLGGE